LTRDKIIVNYINQGENKLNEEDFFKNLIFAIINKILMQGSIVSMKIIINYIHQGENKLNEEDFFKNLNFAIINETLMQGSI
jgi:hypothetical protein